jgi:hypothetical protein
VLGEFDREPSAGRSVEPVEKPFDHTLSNDLKTAELRYLHGIEQIEAGTAGGGVGTRHQRATYPPATAEVKQPVTFSTTGEAP